jgi:hypothetical protein
MALPRDIERILKRIEPRFRKAFTEAFADITSAIVLRDVVDAIEARNVQAALAALRLDEAFFQPLDRAIADAFFDGGSEALARIPVDPNTGRRFILGFDARHTRAEAWVREHAGGLITEIVADQRRMAQQVIEAQIAAGTNPRTAALDIVGRVDRATGQRQGGFIGLTSQQAGFVQNARAQLENLDAGYFDRKLRDKRFDRLVARAIREEKPLSARDVEQISNRYKDRILKMRGDTIARTESITALRAGRHEGFEQLVDSGQVRADQITRVWDATGDSRTREDHAQMDGQEVVGFDAPFIAPDGSRMMFPGDTSLGATAEQTIQCRCFERIRVRYI